MPEFLCKIIYNYESSVTINILQISCIFIYRVDKNIFILPVLFAKNDSYLNHVICNGRSVCRSSFVLSSCVFIQQKFEKPSAVRYDITWGFRKQFTPDQENKPEEVILCNSFA